MPLALAASSQPAVVLSGFAHLDGSRVRRRLGVVDPPNSWGPMTRNGTRRAVPAAEMHCSVGDSFGVPSTGASADVLGSAI